VGIDVAPSAIERARRAVTRDGVEFHVLDVIEYDAATDRPWDLIIFSETIYAVASHYSLFELASLATRLFDATANGGRLLMANTIWAKDLLARPLLVRTYRDLFVNIGYAGEAEEDLRVPSTGRAGGAHLAREAQSPDDARQLGQAGARGRFRADSRSRVRTFRE